MSSPLAWSLALAGVLAVAGPQQGQDSPFGAATTLQALAASPPSDAAVIVDAGSDGSGSTALLAQMGPSKARELVPGRRRPEPPPPAPPSDPPRPPLLEPTTPIALPPKLPPASRAALPTSQPDPHAPPSAEVLDAKLKLVEAARTRGNEVEAYRVSKWIATRAPDSPQAAAVAPQVQADEANAELMARVRQADADSQAKELLLSARGAAAGGNPDQARTQLKKLLADYPDTPAAEDAKKLLAELP